MYLFFFKILSFIRHPKRFLQEHTLVAFSKLRVERGNSVKTHQTLIRKSRILLQGSDNTVDLREADIFNSTIRITGSNNNVIIHNNVRVYNMNILVQARNGVVEIGEGTHFGGGAIVCGGEKNDIRIGADCMISEGVDIWNSDTHVISINGKDIIHASPIVIGNHVWLGKGVTVLKGVTIGDNAIVGMKSVVTRNLRPGTINAGVPAREIRTDANWRK